MKKLLKLLALMAAAAVIFTACPDPVSEPAVNPPVDNPAEENPSEEGPTVVKEFGKGEFIKFADYGITAENAGDYIVKVSYTISDDSKIGWGPGAFNTASWAGGDDTLNTQLNIRAEGYNEISCADIIAVSDLATGFLVNWWADYATITKIELIKK